MKRSSIFIVNDTSFSFNKQFKVNFAGVGNFFRWRPVSHSFTRIAFMDAGPFCLVENKEEVW